MDADPKRMARKPEHARVLEFFVLKLHWLRIYERTKRVVSLRQLSVYVTEHLAWLAFRRCTSGLTDGD